MDEIDYMEVRKNLEVMRAEALSAIETETKKLSGDSGRSADLLDVSDGRNSKENRMRYIQIKREDVVKIDAALSRIAAGTYGLCPGCGEPIAKVRLNALPFAIRCVDCEEAAKKPRRKLPYSISRVTRLSTRQRQFL